MCIICNFIICKSLHDSFILKCIQKCSTFISLWGSYCILFILWLFIISLQSLPQDEGCQWLCMVLDITSLLGASTLIETAEITICSASRNISRQRSSDRHLAFTLYWRIITRIHTPVIPLCLILQWTKIF